jgi:hypothetical protein
MGLLLETSRLRPTLACLLGVGLPPIYPLLSPFLD